MSTPLLGRFRAVILCEDIRREDNGKLFIVGILANDIEYESLPATSIFRLYVELYEEQDDDKALNFVWKLDDEIIAEVKGSIRMIEPGLVPISLPPLMLNLERPGSLTIEATFDDGQTGVIARRKVTLKTPTA